MEANPQQSILPQLRIFPDLLVLRQVEALALLRKDCREQIAHLNLLV
jgi:hypothetical protein